MPDFIGLSLKTRQELIAAILTSGWLPMRTPSSGEGVVSAYREVLAALREGTVKHDE